ncbi:MAG: hypothetical protein R3D55_07635 [Chloroflexota bacterium]
MAFSLTVGGLTFLMAVIWGSPLVELMRRLKMGKQIRIDGPQTHMVKMGTPAMGGILIVGWVLIISILVNIVQAGAGRRNRRKRHHPSGRHDRLLHFGRH